MIGHLGWPPSLINLALCQYAQPGGLCMHLLAAHTTLSAPTRLSVYCMHACRRELALRNELHQLQSEHTALSTETQREVTRLSQDRPSGADQRVAVLTAANAQLLQACRCAVKPDHRAN